MAVLEFPSITPSSVDFGIRFNTQINVSPLSGSVQTIEIPGSRWVASLSFDNLDEAEGRVLAAFLTELRGSSGRFHLFDHTHRNPRGTNLAGGAITIDVQTQAALETGTVTAGSPTTLEADAETFIASDIITIGDYVRNITKDEMFPILSFTETIITINGTWVVDPVNTDTFEIFKGPRGNTIPTVGWTATQTGALLPGDYIEIGTKELKMVTESVDADGSGNAIITFEPPIRTEPTDTSTVVRSDCETIMLLDNDENRWNSNNAGLLTRFNISCAEGF